MSLSRFAIELSQALTREPLPAKVLSEQDFERRFIVPIATRVASHHPGVLLYTHPFRSKVCCTPKCTKMPPAGNGRVVGCPRCWAASKVWASVAAFGTHHTFDLVARDRSKTLALELKLAVVKGGRMPNGDIQRFLGQCSLAATKHNAVIGVFGYRGSLNDKWQRDTEVVMKSLRGQNVRLAFRAVD